MEEILKVFKDKVNKGAEYIREKTKACSPLEEARENKKKLINYLGEKTYMCFNDGIELPTEIKQCCTYVQTLEKEIEKMEESIKMFCKGKVCICGCENSDKAKFCIKCGSPLGKEEKYVL